MATDAIARCAFACSAPCHVSRNIGTFGGKRMPNTTLKKTTTSTSEKVKKGYRLIDSSMSSEAVASRRRKRTSSQKTCLRASPRTWSAMRRRSTELRMNFTDYIREAHRTLKRDGLLLIWEARGRFEDLTTFTRELERLGFRAHGRARTAWNRTPSAAAGSVSACSSWLRIELFRVLRPFRHVIAAPNSRTSSLKRMTCVPLRVVVRGAPRKGQP